MRLSKLVSAAMNSVRSASGPSGRSRGVRMLRPRR
jgi:hypothetical protein